MSRAWKPGDVARLTITKTEEIAVGVRNRRNTGWEHSGRFGDGSAFDSIGGFVARPLVLIDPEDRDQVMGLRDALAVDPGPAGYGWYWVQKALRSLLAPAKPEPEAPIVHAVMYRDHKMGTLCDSGAWGTPALFTAITEHVTCPGCRDKLDPGQVAS